MKLIHCADLHLDSPLQTHLSAEQAHRRSIEITNTFCRLTAYAAEQGVAMVLISGDLFDGSRVSGRTVETLLDAIRQTPQVQYLYIAGNHDDAAHAFADRELPENLTQFGTEWGSLSLDGVAVCGIEMTAHNADTLYNDIPLRPGCCNLVLLHGQVGSVSGVDCVNLGRLKGRGIDYLALGHLHGYQQQPLDENGLWCYPGCLEGRGFDECGPKGFVLLDIAEGRVRPAFIPFASRTLHRLPVEVGDLASNPAAARRLREAADAAGVRPEDMVEFLLTGGCSPESDLVPAYLENLLRDDYFFVKVKDERTLSLRYEDYRNDISLKGEFIRQVLAGEEPMDDKLRILRAGLEALTGEEVTL